MSETYKAACLVSENVGTFDKCVKLCDGATKKVHDHDPIIP